MLRLGLSAILVLFALAAGRAEQQTERLSLDEARAYLIVLINRDRGAMGLKLVTADPIATGAGQKHAEEMAVEHYMSHWDRAGKAPDQRYTEAGGVHHVKENVYLKYVYGSEESKDPLVLDAAPTFTKTQIQEIEAAFFNQRPPYNGHRANILDPSHTHVGIGLARAALGDDARTIANAEEFVDRWLDVDPIPAQAKVGDQINISGRALNGASVAEVRVGRAEPDAPMAVVVLSKTSSYSIPRAFSRTDCELGAGGKFKTQVQLSDDGRPGIYYVSILAQRPDGGMFIASQRTVVVKQ